MQNKKRGLSSDRDVSALYNNPLKRVSLDIPTMVEFPLYPVPLFVPDLCGFRIISWTAIMADLLILSDVVDLSRGISLIFLAARGTGPAPALLHSVTSITPGWPFAALYQPDIVVVPVLIVVRVLVEDARCRPATPGADGVFGDPDLTGGNMAGTVAPFPQVFPVLINGVVEVRHSEPFLNFMIVYFL